MSLSVLIPALLDFERTPGRYPLARREPAALFQRAHTVLLLAAGRPVEGLDSVGVPAQAQARRAARFFVRAALLRPGSDPYTVLGLTRSADADAVRAHYRLMIRLTHPDFSGGDSEWPVDAAARINLANDVLSSASRRAELDRSLSETDAATAGPAGLPRQTVRPAFASVASKAPATQGRGVTGKGPEGVGRRFEIPKGMKLVVLGLGAATTTLGLLAINPPGEDRSLVARDRLKHPDPSTDPQRSPPAAIQSYRLESADDDLGSPADSARLPTAALNLPADPVGMASAQPAAAPATPLAKPPTPFPARPAPHARHAADTALALALRPKPVGVSPPPAAPVAVEPVAARPQAGPLEPEPVAVAVTVTPPAATVAAPPAAPAAPAVLVAPVIAPRLAEVQPMLNRIELTAQKGLGLPLARLIHASKRHTPGTQKFVFDFQDALAGYRVTGVTRTDLDSREVGDQLDVDLRMLFNLEDVQGSNLSRRLGVRARFGKVDDNVVLIGMTLIPKAGSK